jgi:hypothetical protein
VLSFNMDSLVFDSRKLLFLRFENKVEDLVRGGSSLVKVAELHMKSLVDIRFTFCG